jgi:hypothetical protein
MNRVEQQGRVIAGQAVDICRYVPFAAAHAQAGEQLQVDACVIDDFANQTLNAHDVRTRAGELSERYSR